MLVIKYIQEIFLKEIDMPTKIRNSAFEILRIIAILFIIAHHFAVHGGFDFSSLSNSGLVVFNHIYIDGLAQLGKIGVNIFILISAFFLSDSKRFRTSKIIHMVIEMVFIAVVYGVLLLTVEKQKLSFDLFRLMFFPNGTELWWFMSIYLLLYILSPFINRALSLTSSKLHLVFIFICLAIWSIFPTFLQLPYYFDYIPWFFTLYLIGAYIKREDKKLPCRPVFGILITIAVFASIFAIREVIQFKLEYQTKWQFALLYNWFNMVVVNNLPQLVVSLLLFLSFKDMNIKPNKVINFIASSTLTIYLVHDHYYARVLIWIRLFKVASFIASPWLALYSIGVVLAVFFMAFICDIIYRFTIKLLVNKLVDYLDRKVLYKVDNLFSFDTQEQQ